MSVVSVVLVGIAVIAYGSLVLVGSRLLRKLTARLGRIGSGGIPNPSVGDPYRHGRRVGLGRFVRPYRGPLAVSVLLSLTATVLALGAPWPLKLIIDNALGGMPLPSGLPLIGGMKGLGVVHVAVALGVGLVVTAAIVSYVTSVLVGTTSLNIAADLRVAVFDRLLHLPVQVHDKHRSGDLVTRLTSDVSRVQEALVARVQVALPGLVTLVGMTALMLFLDVTLTLVVLAAMPPLVVLTVIRQRRVATVQRAARTRAGELASHAAEVMRHVRAVQTFSQEHSESARFRRMSGTSAQTAGEALRTSGRMAPTADLLLATVLGGVLWTGTARVLAKQITLGELMIFLSYLGAVRVPIRALSGLAGTIGRGKASEDRLWEVLAESNLIETDRPVQAPRGQADIRLEGVRFGYRAGTPVLRDVSLTVRAGQTVCIVGKTGAGKSTLLSLLVRLHDPDAGIITTGGVELREMTLADVRARAAFVPQDAWVMAGTIRENVIYGRPGASDAAVRIACQDALVDEFADRLPDGYDTPVGDGGTLLSGGQRRRVALARALLLNCPVLLLDEPTSGLDATSEALVIEAIGRASATRTVVIVTHQMSLAETADHVVVLEDGRVAQSGPPERLRAVEAGPYAKLLHSQRVVNRSRPYLASDSNRPLVGLRSSAACALATGADVVDTRVGGRHHRRLADDLPPPRIRQRG